MTILVPNLYCRIIGGGKDGLWVQERSGYTIMRKQRKMRITKRKEQGYNC